MINKKLFVSRSSNYSNQNNSRPFIFWRFTNRELCVICLKNMNTKSFIAYKINIISCTCALQLPFIRKSKSGEINSQHPPPTTIINPYLSSVTDSSQKCHWVHMWIFCFASMAAFLLEGCWGSAGSLVDLYVRISSLCRIKQCILHF